MQQIQEEFEQDDKDLHQAALEFNKVDLAAAEDAKKKKKKKIEGILDAAADLPPDNTIIDDDIKIENIYIGDGSLFDEKNTKQEDREFIEDLLKETNFAEIGNLKNLI